MNPSRTTPPFVKRADSDHIVVHVQEDALSAVPGVVIELPLKW
jgi:hypothetical protein